MRSVSYVSSIYLLALGVSGCEAGSTEPPQGVTATVNGQAHTVDGGALPALWAVWTPADGGIPDSSRVEADGTFGLTVTTTTTTTEGELRISGADTGSYHPFLFPFSLSELSDIVVVMIPRMWRIRRGEYAGHSVATPLDLVVDDDADMTFYSYYQGQPYPRQDPTHYLLDLMIWPQDSLPAKVAIDHQNSDRVLTLADSVSLWGVLDVMESVMGLNLFEPIVADPTWWPVPTGPFDGESVPGTIRITAQPPGWRADLQFLEGTELWEQELDEWASGSRFDAFRVEQRFLDGGALVLGEFEPLRLADGLIDWKTVMTHEMLHLLGAGHTCRMESPMGPCARTAAPSRFDVAYLELLGETVRVQRELGTPYGLMPAIIGERRLLLGLPALPDLSD